MVLIEIQITFDMHINQFISQFSPEKLLLEVDYNSYRSPQMINEYIIKTGGIFNPKWDVCITSVSLRLNYLQEM